VAMLADEVWWAYTDYNTQAPDAERPGFAVSPKLVDFALIVPPGTPWQESLRFRPREVVKSKRKI
jgi:hypothetical protein